MKKLSLIVFLSLFCFSANVFSANFDFDGSIRNRFAYSVNKDGDSAREADFGVMDVRGRLSVQADVGGPFFAYYELELGNITWGEEVLGGSLGTDGANVETKNLFIGYDFEPFAGEVGLIEFDSPLKAAIDDDLAGMDIRFLKSGIKAEAMFSLLSAGTNTTNFNSEARDFEVNIMDDAHLYYAATGYKNEITDLDIYYLRLNDQQWDYNYHLNYIGIYNELEISVIKFNAGFCYNTGNIDDNGTNISVNSHFLYGEIEAALYEKTDVFKAGLFARVNMSSGNDTNTDAIEQFQVIQGQGKLNTGLSILFGGSPYNQVAYFDNRVSTVDNRRNVTEGALRFDDPGIFIIEGGINLEYLPLSLESQILAGYAMTSKSVNGNNLLGIEFDWHNKIEVSEKTGVELSVAMLLPGNALRDVYNISHSDVLLGGDPSFKIDGQIEIKL